MPLLQQYLPFTVLKHLVLSRTLYILLVATVPTVYGIETRLNIITSIISTISVATVPTVYGIETTPPS